MKYIVNGYTGRNADFTTSVILDGSLFVGMSGERRYSEVYHAIKPQLLASDCPSDYLEVFGDCDFDMNDSPQVADATLHGVSRLSPEAGSRPKASSAGEACAPFVCRPASSALPTTREPNGKFAVRNVLSPSREDARRSALEASGDAWALSPPAKPPSAPLDGALAPDTVDSVGGIWVSDDGDGQACLLDTIDLYLLDDGDDTLPRIGDLDVRFA